MKRVFVPTETGTDWQRLLAKPELHWRAGRSAMTAAASWDAAGDRLPAEIAALLDASGVPELSNLQLLAAFPEWEVPLPGGSRSSFTDVLSLARNDAGLCVIAAEAKAGEDFGPTVGERWQDPSPGLTTRLNFLQSELGAVFGPHVRYQLLHRTVSALLTARDFHAPTAVMLVHAWNATDEQRGDFDLFCDVLGARAVSPNVLCLYRQQGPALYLAWCDGQPAFASTELPSSTSARTLLAAIDFAADKHRMQRRNDAEASPYINHPISVAQLLAACGVEDGLVLTAAVLHDTVEDTATTEAELRERFGKKVAAAVMDVTDDKKLLKEVRKRLQVEHAPHASRCAALIKLADKTCNLRDLALRPPASWTVERLREYFDWAAAVVERLPAVNEQLEARFWAAMEARP